MHPPIPEGLNSRLKELVSRQRETVFYENGQLAANAIFGTHDEVYMGFAYVRELVPKVYGNVKSNLMVREGNRFKLGFHLLDDESVDSEVLKVMHYEGKAHGLFGTVSCAYGLDDEMLHSNPRSYSNSYLISKCDGSFFIFEKKSSDINDMIFYNNPEQAIPKSNYNRYAISTIEVDEYRESESSKAGVAVKLCYPDPLYVAKRFDLAKEKGVSSYIKIVNTYASTTIARKRFLNWDFKL